MTSSKMIFKTKLLTTSRITSICPSRDGHRLLMGSVDGTVRMRDLEDFGSSQPVIQDVTDRPEIIGFSPSGKMVATKSRRPDHVGLRDTTTWEFVGSTDVEYEGNIEVAFSADDKRIAVLSRNHVTICDIMHPENRLSFDPWPKGRRVRLAPGLDHSECTSSLDINMSKYSDIFLAPNGLSKHSLEGDHPSPSGSDLPCTYLLAYIILSLAFVSECSHFELLFSIPGNSQVVAILLSTCQK